MLLAIDVGNTNIVLGVFDGNDPRAQLASAHAARTHASTSSDCWSTVCSPTAACCAADIHGIVLGSVVPPVTGTMRGMIARYFGLEPLVVDPAGNSGMPILYENPAEVGADRIVNAIAAYEQYGRATQLPLIVCDFGTATTLDAVSANGEYLGGAICPGVHDLGRRAVSARRAVAAHRRAETGDR